MNAPDDQMPAGILIFDGDRMTFALAPDDVRPMTARRLAAGKVEPEALLVCAMAEPRRQRTGPQALGDRVLRDYPFYAFAEDCGPKALAAIDASRTPFDRMLVRAPSEAAPGTLAVADGEAATLLAAAFADLAGRGDSASERLHAKWAFGDIKRVLAARLGRLARESARANRPLRLVHYRRGDGGWSLAVDPSIDYVGVDGPGSAGGAVAPDALSRETFGEAGLFLLTDLPADADLAAELAPLGAVSARRSVVIAALPHTRTGNAEHRVVAEPRINRLSAALQAGFGGTCDLRRIETLAHKPFDALPGTTIVEFEVTR